MILKQRLTFGLLLGLALALTSCGDSGGTTPTAEAWIDADYLADYSEVLACRPNAAAHNGSAVRVQVFPDSAATAYIAARTGGSVVFEPGTLIVKTEYRSNVDCDTPFLINVMRKRTGGDVARLGDWEWQELNPALEVLREGSISECSSCHAACDPDWDYSCVDFDG